MLLGVESGQIMPHVERLLTWTNRTRIGVVHQMNDYHPLLWQTSYSIRGCYSSGWYGSFVWEIQVRYNKKYLVIFDLSRFSITFFLLPNQVDLSAHCSYHFSASNVRRLRCNNTFYFPMEISVIKFQAWPIWFLRLLLLTIKTHFWLSNVLDYHFVQSDLVGRGFLKA